MPHLLTGIQLIRAGIRDGLDFPDPADGITAPSFRAGAVIGRHIPHRPSRSTTRSNR